MPFRSNPGWIAFVASLALLGVLVALLIWETGPPGRAPGSGPLMVHCAASIRAPLEATARDYEREYGQHVEGRFGASQDLLTGIELSGQGDLFLPADESYIEAAGQKGLLAEVLPLARQHAVVLVRSGYPGSIASWSDLTAEGVRLAVANQAAAIGKLTHDRLVASGRWAELERRTVVTPGTVTDVANAVRLGSVDAGVVWDSVAALHPGLPVVRLPELAPVVARVEVAVLKSSARPAGALRFARYLAAPDKGLPHFRAGGFAVSGLETP
jgi:molybdate transport system substrate-binding protein